MPLKSDFDLLLRRLARPPAAIRRSARFEIARRSPCSDRGCRDESTASSWPIASSMAASISAQRSTSLSGFLLRPFPSFAPFGFVSILRSFGESLRTTRCRSAVVRDPARDGLRSRSRASGWKSAASRHARDSTPTARAPSPRAPPARRATAPIADTAAGGRGCRCRRCARRSRTPRASAGSGSSALRSERASHASGALGRVSRLLSRFLRSASIRAGSNFSRNPSRSSSLHLDDLAQQLVLAIEHGRPRPFQASR